MVLVKNLNFFHLFLKINRPGKCVRPYSRKEKVF